MPIATRATHRHPTGPNSNQPQAPARTRTNNPRASASASAAQTSRPPSVIGPRLAPASFPAALVHHTSRTQTSRLCSSTGENICRREKYIPQAAGMLVSFGRLHRCPFLPLSPRSIGVLVSVSQLSAAAPAALRAHPFTTTASARLPNRRGPREPRAGTTTPLPYDHTEPSKPKSPFYFEAGYALYAKRPSRPFPPPFLSTPSTSFSEPLSTHHRSRDRRPYVNGEMIRGVTNGDDAVLVSDSFIGANDGVGAWAAKEKGHAA